MKNFKRLRKPHFMVILLFPIFMFSCIEENKIQEIPKNEFSYSDFELFKNNFSLVESIYEQDDLNSEILSGFNRDLLGKINVKLGTTVEYPDILFSLLGQDKDKIWQTGLTQGWMKKWEIELFEKFIYEWQNDGFNISIQNFEERVINLNLNRVEFQKKNLFINILKSLAIKNPKLFSSIENLESEIDSRIVCESVLRCAGAVVALAAATASLSSCATVLACGGAILLHIIAIDSVAVSCEGCLTFE